MSMTKQQLLERKALYEAKKIEIEMNTYEAERALDYAKAKAEIDAKYEQIKKEDTQKVTHYIELLTELVIEASKEEPTQEQIALEDVSKQD